MDHAQRIKTTLAAAATLGLLTAPTVACAQGLEPCWGVAKAGQNACGNISATHTCSGLSKIDNDPGEWTFVAKGTCKKIGGFNREQAAAKVKAATKAEAAASAPAQGAKRAKGG